MSAKSKPYKHEQAQIWATAHVCSGGLDPAQTRAGSWFIQFAVVKTCGGDMARLWLRSDKQEWTAQVPSFHSVRVWYNFAIRDSLSIV